MTSVEKFGQYCFSGPLFILSAALLVLVALPPDLAVLLPVIVAVLVRVLGLHGALDLRGHNVLVGNKNSTEDTSKEAIENSKL
jgi:hypothetical protein